MKRNLAHEISETGLLPDAVLRRGIKRLLKTRLDEIFADDIETIGKNKQRFLEVMQESDIAVQTGKANEQHYEVPAGFYEKVLGPHLKYSCCEWRTNTHSLEDAERNALRTTCARAGIKNGMTILEAGCGWGSLTVWMAEQFPDSSIVAVSNSESQGTYIRERLQSKNLSNVEVVTADMNHFVPEQQFDRIVSVEMFEHMRNWKRLLRNISDWLNPEGQFFMHIFVHRSTPYLFEVKDPSDWMSRWFFSGGMMPSADLPLLFQDQLSLEKCWYWEGKHYAKTCNEWLKRMDHNRETLMPVLENTYGKDFAKIWWMRWRLFFMACAELFAYKQGQEWFVGHYRFGKKTGVSN